MKKLTLSDDMLKLIVETACDRAIEAYKQEEKVAKEQKKDKRYKNTKLLLRHYRALMDYANNTIYDIADMEVGEDIEDVLNMFGDAGKVASIRERVVFTKVTMENVRRAIESYREYCESSNRADIQRRWRVLNALYISGYDEASTAKEIAKTEGIGLRTVYDDIDKIVDDMEKRFFGLDENFID